MRTAVLAAFLAVVGATSVVAVLPQAHDYYHYPVYQYSYGVADKLTGDHKSAQEVRNGGLVKGSYQLVQPDGVLRLVNYISTPHGGFQAQVINKGVAGHPAVYGYGHGHGLRGGGGRYLG